MCGQGWDYLWYNIEYHLLALPGNMLGIFYTYHAATLIYEHHNKESSSLIKKMSKLFLFLFHRVYDMQNDRFNLKIIRAEKVMKTAQCNHMYLQSTI